MKAVQNVYCTLPFLEEAIRRRKESAPHKIALRIMENLSNIYLDIPQEELVSRVKEDQVFRNLFKRENKTFRSKIGWRSSLQFEAVTDEVCFVHPDYIQDYKKLREEFGCLIIASDNDFHLIERMNDKRGYVCIVPEDERISHLEEAYQKSWEEAIRTCPVTPVNSIIISDNYLFSKITSRKEKGLFALLNTVVPENLKIPFHIAIFSLIAERYNFSAKDAEKLVQEIKELFPGREDYIKVTIVIHTKKTTTHDREIITNYHRITSGAGFSIIEDEDGVAEVAKGHIEPVFHAVSTTPSGQFITKHFHFQTIEWLKLIYQRKAGTGGGSFIVGDKVHRMLDE